MTQTKAPSPPNDTILSYARTIPRSIFLLYFLFLAGIFGLLALPFSISGISFWSGRIMGKEWSSGFSGITYAFLGLLAYDAVLIMDSGVFRPECSPMPF